MVPPTLLPAIQIYSGSLVAMKVVGVTEVGLRTLHVVLSLTSSSSERYIL